MSRIARSTVSLVTGPLKEPVTVSEAKEWAKIDDDDNNSTIDLLLSAVRWSAEQYMRRALVTQTLMLTLDLSRSLLNDQLQDGFYEMPISELYGGLSRTIELPMGSIQSITGVNTYALDNSVSAFASSNYFLDTAGKRLVLNIGCIWPVNLRQRAAVEITYVAGYGDDENSIPPPLKQGMLIHFADAYESRGQGGDSSSFIPERAMALYDQFRIRGFRK